MAIERGKEMCVGLGLGRKRESGGVQSTCTHNATMSANRESDLTGYIPCKEESTMLANASISWSWGIAHLTNDCSPLSLVLHHSEIRILYVAIASFLERKKKQKEKERKTNTTRWPTCPKAFFLSIVLTSQHRNCKHHFAMYEFQTWWTLGHGTQTNHPTKPHEQK